MPLVYYVEDDQSISYIIEKTIENANYSGVSFNKGMPFLESFKKKIPDLILLDLMLPDVSGIDLVKAIRKINTDVPIIIVSALQDEMDKVTALDAGADDYMTKPFGVLELTSRMQSKLRKLRDYKILSYENIVIDLRKHIVKISDKEIYLTNKEFDILRVLVKNQHQVVPKENIFRDVWDTTYIGETRTLDMHIKSLRQKLSGSQSEAIIKTIRGVGYQIEPKT
ncbi:MAG TPA: DNA-binding response regulator [Acholeplasmataceae bacterium]|nr:DNA-binding response regulator [Acholeplasmataceae bacterium]